MWRNVLTLFFAVHWQKRMENIAKKISSQKCLCRQNDDWILWRTNFIQNTDYKLSRIWVVTTLHFRSLCPKTIRVLHIKQLSLRKTAFKLEYILGFFKRKANQANNTKYFKQTSAYSNLKTEWRFNLYFYLLATETNWDPFPWIGGW